MNLATVPKGRLGFDPRMWIFKRNVRSSLPTLNSSLFESRTERIYLNVGFIMKTRHAVVSVFSRRFFFFL